ncbi:NADH dehydrogenase [ubiquinone] 1 alpha subcomplex subunit 5 isoform X2 [Latimeria chalumnae]|uniref:NADH dehydrogenase [ubiquinone] 1 alpha subcomplex subunit 5 isoform X2 n=1 Tax=Latimeria chalumnae TaxID=7897 RepID=UPI00313B5C05
MMAGVLKKTTGLVGLAVAQQPHEHLRILYTKIIAALQTIPRDAAYRKYTEQIVNERMDLVNKEPDVQKLEDKINCGQIEEVISQFCILGREGTLSGEENG